MKYPLLLLCMLLVGCNGLDIADRGNADENRDQATTPVQALMDGRPERARELLEAGADPNLANQFGDTALIWAVNDGQVDLVNLLLEKGADVNHRGSEGRTALHRACRKPNGEILMALIGAGANVNAIDDQFQTPVMMAAKKNSFATIQLLAKNGAKLNQKDNRDETALHKAVHEGAGEAVEALVITGADLDITSLEGETPLEMALRLDRRRMFQTGAVLKKHPKIKKKIEALYKEVTLNRQSRPKYKIDFITRRIHELVNVERRKEGLPPLGYDGHLERIAVAHSDDMLRNNFFSHTNKQGEEPTDRAKRGGYQVFGLFRNGVYKNGIGENIYSSSTYRSAETIFMGNTKQTRYNWRSNEDLAQEAVQGWMDSPGHRANILGDKYVREGIGVAIKGDKVMITQNFW